MPVPEGNISTSAVWSEEVIDAAIVAADAEEFSEDQAAYDAAMADAIEEAKDKVNDLPELS